MSVVVVGPTLTARRGERTERGNEARHEEATGEKRREEERSGEDERGRERKSAR